MPDPDRIITSGHGNQTARTIAIRQGETIDRRAFTALIRQIVANNRAGGWRTVKKMRSRQPGTGRGPV